MVSNILQPAETIIVIEGFIASRIGHLGDADKWIIYIGSNHHIFIDIIVSKVVNFSIYVFFCRILYIGNQIRRNGIIGHIL